MAAKAFVLAAGLGTRLRPLTNHRPKPLVPVCGVPMLEQALELCRLQGLREVVVNAHHLHEQVAEYLDSVVDLRIHLQVEQPKILGTGGGLRRALPLLEDPFAVLNSDILCLPDLPRLLALCSSDNCWAAMLLRASQRASDFGLVLPDRDGVVVRLTSLAQAPASRPARQDTHFTGIHAMTHAAMELVPPRGFACVVRTVYQSLVPLGRVGSLLHGDYWLDVGTPRRYLDANLSVLGGRIALPADPWPAAAHARNDHRSVGGPRTGCRVAHGAELLPPFWLGKGVEVEPGVRLGPHVVVGHGARIGRGTHISQSVVWDGLLVPPDSRLDRAVVHDGGLLAV